MYSSKRLQALANTGRTGGTPKVTSMYGGWYDAPNGKRYFGLGKVVEIGITHDGGTYVRVEPTATRTGTNTGTRFDFFDPATDEDMPRDQYPKDLETRRRAIHVHRPGTFVGEPTLGLGPGDTKYGLYISARNVTHYGVGKIVRAELGKDGKLCGRYTVEPPRLRGGLPFWELYIREDILDEDLPRSPYSGSLETQQREDKNRPRRHELIMLNFMDVRLSRQGGQVTHPQLGSEHVGAYFAPDGQWFVGAGKIVAVGYVLSPISLEHWYVYVEPTAEKGGDYDFFHPVTREWMDELPSNAIPGVQCSVSQRKKIFASRWRDLPPIRRKPEIGAEYHGRYCPPSAPKRDVYVGVGKVVKTGINEKNQIWVEVEPIASKRGNLHYKFWDPWSGKEMPDQYWPLE
ncbi:uncharacterized protein DSM5745_09590 [Aspergillus mulundensis]|uniref:Uncharacterized protein n=1 Tax=Aspergillus mulundensis TaxID=1810919 RepID=A0A3D8QVY1_9EURO|nr:hypothetical protein DSM5745_09590 [Aspergillus mulundensis]RDW65851.1 hypothetical protein DSM5745_09590 [Aspergillus mulundensis]